MLLVGRSSLFSESSAEYKNLHKMPRLNQSSLNNIIILEVSLAATNVTTRVIIGAVYVLHIFISAACRVVFCFCFFFLEPWGFLSKTEIYNFYTLRGLDQSWRNTSTTWFRRMQLTALLCLWCLVVFFISKQTQKSTHNSTLHCYAAHTVSLECKASLNCAIRNWICFSIVKELHSPTH